jgi:DNA polymerase III subunit delta
MIYLIFGEDTFRSWQKITAIKHKYLNASKGDTDFVELDGTELTAQLFRSHALILPFLANSRLVIVRNLLTRGKKEAQEIVLEGISQIPNSTVVFFYEEGLPDKRTKLFQALNRPKIVQQFHALSGPQLIRYVTDMAAGQGIRLRPQFAEILLERCNGDLWRVRNELEKISLYKGKPTEEATITEDELNLLVTGTGALHIFSLTDAFGQRSARQAVALLAKVDPDEAIGTLAIIAGHYRNLILIAEGIARQAPRSQLARELALHPFVFEKSLVQAKGYTYEELTSCYHFLLMIDIASKSSFFDPLVGLATLAASLTQKPLTLPELSEVVMVY